MEADNFFFRPVNSEVVTELKYRKGLVGKFEGAKRKPAFVEIYQENAGTYTKILPKIGTGFSDTYSTTTKKPIPTLGTVTVEMDGDFGSLRRATAEFTCYDMDSFDELERTLLRPGNKIAIRYGYLNADKTTDQSQGPINLGGKKLGYEFVIYDYTFTYTKENYIKCSFKAVGPGVMASSANFGTSVQTSFRNNGDIRKFRRNFDDLDSYTEVQALEDVFDYDLVASLLKQEKVDSIGIGKTIGINIYDGYAEYTKSFISMLKIPTDYTVADAIEETNWSNTTYVAYCSLSYIVHNLINEEILNNPSTSENFRKIRYVCNSEVSSLTTYSKYIFSADPLNVGITGTSDIQMRYGLAVQDAEKTFDFTWTGIYEFPDFLTIRGSKLDCSNILISRLLLRSILKKFSKDKFSINDFFDKLFDAISTATGGMITLGLYEPDLNLANDKEKALYNKYSLSGDYTPILIKPLKQKPDSIPGSWEFDPLKGDGITRSCEVTAKVPKDMAAEAFGRNAPGESGGNTGTDGGQISEVLSGKTLVNQYLPDKAIANLKDKVYPENKLSGNAIEDGKSFLKDIMNKATPLTKRLQAEQILYPLEMKLVLDGIEGFRFGDHISTTNIPAVYRKSSGLRVGFTVLRTTHTIAANDWTTELTTIARLVNG